ncbi:hypothetical protein GFS31_03930 [Leptolyngbya sp. BL0902]|nr:hypothetical protein GFS31_03930 [Leptolyngbya sp. BL0902]
MTTPLPFKARTLGSKGATQQESLGFFKTSTIGLHSQTKILKL